MQQQFTHVYIFYVCIVFSDSFEPLVGNRKHFFNGISLMYKKVKTLLCLKSKAGQ